MDASPSRGLAARLRVCPPRLRAAGLGAGRPGGQTRNGPAGCAAVHWGEAPGVTGRGRGRGGARAHGGRTEPGHRQPPESSGSAADAHRRKAPAELPGFGFCSAVCPRRASSTAHNSSRGGRPDSCRGSGRCEWEPFAPRPGCRGPRAARGLAGTMASPGPRPPGLELQLTARPGHRCQAGHKGAVFPAGGRMFAQVWEWARRRAWGGGGGSLPAAPGVAAGVGGGGWGAALRPSTTCQPSLGVHRGRWSPGNPPGSGQPSPLSTAGRLSPGHAACLPLGPAGLPHLGLRAQPPPGPGDGPAHRGLCCVACALGAPRKLLMQPRSEALSARRASRGGDAEAAKACLGPQGGPPPGRAGWASPRREGGRQGRSGPLHPVPPPAQAHLLRVGSHSLPSLVRAPASPHPARRAPTPAAGSSYGHLPGPHHGSSPFQTLLGPVCPTATPLPPPPHSERPASPLPPSSAWKGFRHGGLGSPLMRHKTSRSQSPGAHRATPPKGPDLPPPHQRASA